MGFESLLGNPRIKENLNSSLSRGRISHFYLLSGPKGSGKHTLAKLLSAGILCESGGDKPCMVCPACRKVMKDLHPDVITIDDPEKKTVPVDLIRKAREDIFVQPNEGNYKIYIFPRGQDMGIPGQNALLKVLEEPPKYGVFLLLCDNPEKLLPTVRSRGTEFSLQPVSREVLTAYLKKKYPDAEEKKIAGAVSRSGGFTGQAEEILSREDDPTLLPFARAFVRGSRLAMTELLVPLEKKKRDELIPIVDGWIELLEGALSFRSGGSAPSALAERISERLGSRELLTAIEKLKTASEYLQSNVSPAAVCGYLQWWLV